MVFANSPAVELGLVHRGRPDDRAVKAAVEIAVSDRGLLGLCDEFFRHASPVVHTELRRFLADHSHHQATGLGWFIDSLGLTTLPVSATTSRPFVDLTDPTPHRQSANSTAAADVLINA